MAASGTGTADASVGRRAIALLALALTASPGVIVSCDATDDALDLMVDVATPATVTAADGRVLIADARNPLHM